jgi:hypothetical protein
LHRLGDLTRVFHAHDLVFKVLKAWHLPFS